MCKYARWDANQNKDELSELRSAKKMGCRAQADLAEQKARWQKSLRQRACSMGETGAGLITRWREWGGSADRTAFRGGGCRRVGAPGTIDLKC